MKNLIKTCDLMTSKMISESNLIEFSSLYIPIAQKRNAPEPGSWLSLHYGFCHCISPGSLITLLPDPDFTPISSTCNPWFEPLSTVCKTFRHNKWYIEWNCNSISVMSYHYEGCTNIEYLTSTFFLVIECHLMASLFVIRGHFLRAGNHQL